MSTRRASIRPPIVSVSPRPREAEGGPVGRRARVAASIETCILDTAFHFPSRGQDRIARDLRASKVNVSPSGVRYVLQRHDLETLAKRVTRIESALAGEGDWSEEQLAARDRVYAERRRRSVAASMAGPHTAPLPRSAHILAVAARLIRERGFDATSLRDIAVRAHIPLSSIYYHFQTKDDLFVAVYEDGVGRLRDAVAEAIAGATDPWERLQRACATHLHNLCGDDDFMAVSVPTRAPRLSDAAAERVRQQSDGYERLLTDLIGALKLDKGLSRSVLRLQILGALNWTSVWYRPGKLTPRQIASQLIRTVRHGVSARSTETARATVTQSRGRGAPT